MSRNKLQQLKKDIFNSNDYLVENITYPNRFITSWLSDYRISYNGVKFCRICEIPENKNLSLNRIDLLNSIWVSYRASCTLLEIPLVERCKRKGFNLKFDELYPINEPQENLILFVQEVNPFEKEKYIPIVDFHKKYRDWCILNGYEYLSIRKIGFVMRRLGFTSKVKFYMGKFSRKVYFKL